MQRLASPGGQWFTEKQVALMIGCSLSKLRSDRHKCRGISYSKNGKSVRYALSDVVTFMSECRIKAQL